MWLRHAAKEHSLADLPTCRLAGRMVPPTSIARTCCSVITQANRVSSNQSLCCRETEFCRQRQRRRNGSGKPRRPLQRRDPRQQSRQFGVTCPELGNLRLRESAWWRTQSESNLSQQHI